MRLIFFALLSLLCISCSKGYLVVEQEWVDASFLASSWVGTPDPRQECPPMGQRLLVSWDFPLSVFDRKLEVILTMRLWDQTETVISTPVCYRTDSKAFYFPDESENRNKRILTYKIEVVDKSGDLIQEWVHQLWREQIIFKSNKKMSESEPLL